MNVRTKILVLMMVLAALPMSSNAQTPEFPMGWNMGVDTETDAPPTFDLDLEGKATIEFWIDNQNLYSLTLEIEYDIPFDGSVNGPDTVEVSSQSNESFEFSVHGVNVASFTAGISDYFTIDATVTAWGPTPATPGDSKDAEGNLTIPMVVDLAVDLAEPTGPMNAGTTTSLAATVSNSGNAADSVFKSTITDSCPLLEISGEDDLENIAIEANGNMTVFLNISSSASHPTKNCVIEISIQSKGDIDAGRSETADSAEVTLRVVEDRGGSGDDGDNDDNSQSNSDDSDEGGDVVSQNWTPLWPGAVIIAPILAAFNRKKLL